LRLKSNIGALSQAIVWGDGKAATNLTAEAYLALLNITLLKVISRLSRSLDSAVNSSAKKLNLLGGTREAFEELKEACSLVGFLPEQLRLPRT